MAELDAGAADLSLGQVRVLRVPGSAPPKISVVIVRTEAGWRGYWNVCRHLPIPLDAGLGELADGLVCISHGARYRPEDGLCTEGPCRGESLEPVDVSVREDRLIVRW